MDPIPTRLGPRRLAIWEICLLVAGIAVGLWLFALRGAGDVNSVFLWSVSLLGGASVIGPPILLAERRRRKSRWGPGEMLWFATGMSAWLLWPPVVVRQVRNAPAGGPDGDMGTLCFLYGTPLMAIYMGSALLFGGWIRRKGRSRRRRLSWRERFGLALGIAWAATGGYVLYLVYNSR